MDDDAVPVDRWAAHETAGVSSTVVLLRRIADQAAADVPSPIAEGEIDRIVRLSAVMAGAMPLRETVPAGSEGEPAAVDLAVEARTAAKLDNIDATVAAAMVRRAVVFQRGAEAGALSPCGPQT